MKYTIYIVIFAVAVTVSCLIYFLVKEERSTLIGITVGLAIFLSERIYESKKNEEEMNERLARCYRTIEKELNDHEDSFNNREYENMSDNDKLPWKGMFLNIDAYDSLIHSGLFTYFQDKTQDRLANLYIRIRLQNKMIHEKSLVKSMFFMEGFSDEKKKLWPKIAYPYDFSVNGYQLEIKDLLDEVKQLIIGDKKLRNLS